MIFYKVKYYFIFFYINNNAILIYKIITYFFNIINIIFFKLNKTN